MVTKPTLMALQYLDQRPKDAKEPYVWLLELQTGLMILVESSCLRMLTR